MSAGGDRADDHRVANTSFPKHYRLLKTDEYSSVFGFRRVLKSQHFLLHYCPRVAADASGARLGLVVAKRFLRRSVDRNLVKRLAREGFRLLRARLRPNDLVLRLAAKPKALDRRALAQEIQRLLGKLIAAEQ
ncbi:ribonuclease P protein component [Accumulibacter sp.]|uniref:ribonuclease P protein component n=1 Tax=Accumulibacter sp. TaxID=2053492 RepID=UPI002620BFD6|nr:ribonuclease P protein component [Accumulibacter sp.]